MSDPLAAIEGALDALGPNGEHWSHSALREREPDGSVSYCVTGALWEAAPDQESYADARAAMRQTVSDRLDRWNDDPLRSFPEVRQALLDTLHRLGG